jgi:hypothetical protein
MGRQSCIGAGIAALSAVLWHGAAVADDQGAKRDFMSAWTGFDGSMDSQYGYAGALYAFKQDLDADGLILRLGLGGGRYETDGANAHWVDHYDLDVMIGYHLSLGRAAVSVFAGGDFKNHDNADQDADIRGLQLGAKAQIEAYAPLTDQLFVSAFANYSTAFDSFNARAKLGYRVSDTFSVGPETAVLGCEQFDQVRAGIAAAFRIGAAEIAPSAGAAWKFDEEDYGLYGGINLYTRF